MSAPTDILTSESAPARSAITGRARPLRRPVPVQEDGAYRTMILTSIADIDAQRWDRLVGPAAITRSHAYLSAVEAAAIPECRYFYPVVFNARNEIVAHACVYTITTDFAQLLPQALQTVVGFARRAWPKLLKARITECASPLVAGHSLSVAADTPAARLMGRLADATADIAWDEGSSLVVIRDFLPDEAEMVEALQGRGFNCVANMPLARITVRWKSYDEYLAAMKPRYRKDVVRRLRRAREPDLIVRRVEQFGDSAQTWLRQMLVVQQAGSRFKREVLTEEYYQQMDSRLGRDSWLLVAEKDGQAVAHGMVITDRDNTVATFFGREAGKPGREWFLLVDEVIRAGIERGSRYIHLGLGSYEAKALVGAERLPLTILCRSRYRLVNWLMRRVPEIVNRSVRPAPAIFRD
jgi:predicted N-acyltransferase